MNEDDKRQIQIMIADSERRIIEKCGKVERVGLYLMVFYLFCKGCSSEPVSELADKIDEAVENRLENSETH